jgi:hypothetical protein
MPSGGIELQCTAVLGQTGEYPPVLSDDEQIGEFRLEAERVLELMKENSKADYDAESLKWLEQLMLKIRDDMDDQARQSWIGAVGSFLGECMCRAYGGEWVNKDGSWAVSIAKGRLVLLPFVKVAKLIDFGPEDSFVLMFRLVPRILATPKLDDKQA